ncbi:MAG: hypothetical protein U0446_02905 [Dehalococcoidia bacterium]
MARGAAAGSFRYSFWVRQDARHPSRQSPRNRAWEADGLLELLVASAADGEEESGVTILEAVAPRLAEALLRMLLWRP